MGLVCFAIIGRRCLRSEQRRYQIAKADSSWSGKFFSIDQSPDWGAGAPLESIDLQDRNFKFRIPAVNASYEGLGVEGPFAARHTVRHRQS